MTEKRAVKEQTHFLHLNEFGGLEMLQARYHRQRFSRHVHETFCIGVIEEGAQRFYRSGGEHVAPTGDIILVNADDVHTGSSELEGGWAYRAIYPHPDLFRLISRDIRRSEGNIPWFPDAVLHDPGLSEQLLITFNLLSRQGNTLLKETLLLSSLTWLMMRYGKARLPPRKLPSAEQRVRITKELIDSCPEQDMSLMELAETAGLSPWHFLRQFKSVVGIPPHAYLVQARLRKAKALLLKGQSVITVSALCGFTDQSHLHRHFKSSFGITPGEFIRGTS
ncbi:AraC family transcriptional regulator [Zobellella sp. DQSA1]|uniref:AraC family transcriptional regulator n=1 Tax=Zobellella sp. DQSA1 TaxID=3342386 RepID=UPI0035BFAE03